MVTKLHIYIYSFTVSCGPKIIRYFNNYLSSPPTVNNVLCKSEISNANSVRFFVVPKVAEHSAAILEFWAIDPEAHSQLS